MDNVKTTPIEQLKAEKEARENALATAIFEAAQTLKGESLIQLIVVIAGATTLPVILSQMFA